MYVTVFAIANSESRVGRVALFRISFIVREEGSREGRERGIAAFTSNKIPANLSTLQPQRQNSSVEIGDRGVGYRGGIDMGNRVVGGQLNGVADRTGLDAADEFVQKRQEVHGVVRQFYALPVTKTIYA